MFSQEAVDHVQDFLIRTEFPSHLFKPYANEIRSHMQGDTYESFVVR